MNEKLEELYRENFKLEDELYKQKMKYRESCKDAREEIKELKSEKKELQQRIDKAIEYLEKFIQIDTDTILMREKQREYIISILRGEDND